jgi:hypothetical protein
MLLLENFSTRSLSGLTQTTARCFDDILVSLGNANMQAAAPRNAAALTYSGNETSIERSSPVRIGATIPARRLSAEAMPHAVARTRDSKTSGVYPGGGSGFV